MSPPTQDPPPPIHLEGEAVTDAHHAYWIANLKLMGVLLLVWFAVSLGAGVLFVEQLNTIKFFGFKLGFWFAQQGSIYAFVLLIFIYINRVNALEKNYFTDSNPSSSPSASEEEH